MQRKAAIAGIILLLTPANGLHRCEQAASLTGVASGIRPLVMPR